MMELRLPKRHATSLFGQPARSSLTVTVLEALAHDDCQCGLWTHRVSYARPGVLQVAEVPRGKRVGLRRPGVDAFKR